MGIQSVQQGMQVLGGYGYTEDFILEQLSRDVRIMSIYEGTTGIQALALLGRQIPLHNGQSFFFPPLHAPILGFAAVCLVIPERLHCPHRGGSAGNTHARRFRNEP